MAATMSTHKIHSPSPWGVTEQDVLVIIPAFNEEKCIGQVVSGIQRSVPFAEILVINDGSTDNTRAVALRSGANVLNLPHNLGIGGAVRAGFAFAEELGYSWLVRVDGDGQHDAEDIIRLLKPVQQGLVDATFGSRYCGDTNKLCSSPVRRLGIWIYGIVVSFIIGQRITDATSGFWCLNREAIRYFAHYFPQDYPEVESHILLFKAGFSQMEVSVNMYARMAGRSSIGFWRSIYYAFKVMLAAIIRSIQEAPRLPEEMSYAA